MLSTEIDVALSEQRSLVFNGGVVLFWSCVELAALSRLGSVELLRTEFPELFVAGFPLACFCGDRCRDAVALLTAVVIEVLSLFSAVLSDRIIVLT